MERLGFALFVGGAFSLVDVQGAAIHSVKVDRLPNVARDAVL